MPIVQAGGSPIGILEDHARQTRERFPSEYRIGCRPLNAGWTLTAEVVNTNKEEGSSQMPALLWMGPSIRNCRGARQHQNSECPHCFVLR